MDVAIASGTTLLISNGIVLVASLFVVAVSRLMVALAMSPAVVLESAVATPTIAFCRREVLLEILDGFKDCKLRCVGGGTVN